MRIDLVGVVLVVQELRWRTSGMYDQGVEAGRGKRPVGAPHESLQMRNIQLIETCIAHTTSLALRARPPKVCARRRHGHECLTSAAAPGVKGAGASRKRYENEAKHSK